MKPFHLSIVVPNLVEAKSFYFDILHCEPGRNTGDWIDVLFFGHQLTIHQENQSRKAVALDHFGAVLEKQTWLKVSQDLSDNDIEFVMQPKLTNPGAADESGKFLVYDPAGNLLEFKFYSDFDATVKQIPPREQVAG